MAYETFEMYTDDGHCQVLVDRDGRIAQSIHVDRSTADAHGQMLYTPVQAEAVASALLKAAHASRLQTGEVVVQSKQHYSERQ